jgi:DNA-binding NarL/FixJ family response regulator
LTRVAIIDDHEIVRAGFREMLANETGIAIAFEAASGEEALAQLRATPCDVLLLDLALPGQSGVDVMRAVRQRHTGVHVLVLTGYPEEHYALAMMRNGADGYLCKECRREDLLRAVRTVADGRRYLSSRMAGLLADGIVSGAPEAAHERLSERELQVFLHLARGLSVSDIGDLLHLSVKTISTYRTRLLEKLGLSSNAELAAYALRHGLLAG